MSDQKSVKALKEQEINDKATAAIIEQKVNELGPSSGEGCDPDIALLVMKLLAR
jgi:hypothetical protein